MASIATGAKHSAHYIAESTYGTTPATPAWTPVPITAISLGLTKDSLESAKLRADRQVEDLRDGNRQVGGDVTGELEYGSYDDMFEAGLMGTWTANVLKAGVTRRSFSFERYFDLDTDEYHRYTGCEVNSINMSVAPNQMVNITFGIIGQDMTANTAQVTDSTYNADLGNKPFDSFTGSITEGGSPIAIVTQLEMTLENGIEPAFVIGSSIGIRPAEGKSRLTGTLTAFFDSKALYDKFLSETESSIILTLTDLDGNDLEIELPRIKYGTGNPDVSGDGNVTIALPFTALYNSSDASQVVITRTAA